MEQSKEYYAFISYKREDKKEAKRLQHALEYYRLPNHLRQENPELPEYVRPVFRDMTDLEVGELSAQIHSALEQSHFLIVVCSPRAAASKWVNDEVKYFISHDKQDKIIPYIIEGVPHASNPDEECYPPALLNLSKEKELLGANINEVGKDSATIRVVSRMFNIRFDTLFQRYQREQKKRRKQLSAAIILAFLFLAGIAGWIWHQNVLLKERDWKLMTSQAKAVAEKAQLLIDDGDSYMARMLAVKVLPSNLEKPQRPYVPVAEQLLRRAMIKDEAILRWEGKEFEPTSYSPNGKYVVSESFDGFFIWDVRTGGKIGSTRNGTNFHYGYTIPCSFSPDGNSFVYASRDSTLRIWNICSNKHVLVIKHSDDVNSTSFSPDGKYVVSVSADKAIRIWDSKTGKLIGKPLRGNAVFNTISFSSDGKFLVSTSDDCTVRIWDIVKGQMVGHPLTVDFNWNYDDYLISALFSPNNKYVIATSYFGMMMIWDVFSKRRIDIELCCRGEIAHSSSFSPDGKLYAYGYENHVVIVDLCTGQQVCRPLEGHSDHVNCVSFSSDGKLLISASDDRTARLWDLSTKKCIKVLKGHTNDVRTAFFSPDRKYVVSASEDQTARIWDLRTDQELYNVLEWRDYDVSNASFSPDGKYIVSVCNEDYSLKIWDVKTGYQLGHSLKGHREPILSVSFSLDGKYLVSSSEDNTVRFWDLNTKDQVGQPIVTRCESALFSPNSKCVLTLCTNNVSIWDRIKGELIYEIPVSYNVQSACFSPNGMQIVLAVQDSLRIWDVNTHTFTSTFLVDNRRPTKTVSFNPNGTHILSTFDDNTIRIWNIKTGKQEMKIEHDNYVSSASFSADGKYILSISDSTIRVWHAETGFQVLKLEDKFVTFASFNPNGNKILSTSYSYLKIWDFPSLQDLFDQTCERFKNRPLTLEEKHKYYLE